MARLPYMSAPCFPLIEVSDQQTQVLLTIRNRGKGVPYGGSGEPREDGPANYGFKPLNGKPEEERKCRELYESMRGS
jgi:hypothetical protein